MLKVHHVGYAVKRLEKARRQMEAMGYEFACPVDKILADTGPAPYHICYDTDCFEKDMEQLTCGGHRVIVPPAPAAAFEGRRVVFLYSLALGVVEVVER